MSPQWSSVFTTLVFVYFQKVYLELSTRVVSIPTAQFHPNVGSGMGCESEYFGSHCAVFRRILFGDIHNSNVYF